MDIRARKRKKIYRLLLVALLIVVVIGLSRSVHSLYQKKQTSKDNLERIQEQLTQLQSQETRLNRELAKMKTPEGVEEEIVSRFNVAKDGEHVIYIVRNKEQMKTEAVPEETLWEKLLQWF